jgi:5'-nucleotidase/UDP-sugar diphosphatase
MTGDEVKDTLERSASAIVFPGEEEGNVHKLSSGGFLQVSGVRFDINSGGESFTADFDTDTVKSKGNRIENLTVVTKDGIVPIDPDAIYTVAVNDYLAGGGNGYTNIGAIPDDKKVNTEINVIDLLANDIEENSPISPEGDGRIMVIG